MPDFKSLPLYVLRHGECEHNVEGRLASQDDSPLTAKGRDQARANGKLLKEIAHVSTPSGMRMRFLMSSRAGL